MLEPFLKIRDIFNTKVENFSPQYLAFGIFGVINYPLFYLIWEYFSLQSYENLALRLIATILCVPLVVKDRWSEYFRPWLPIYWYLTLLFCLPFFFTFMLLKNNFADVWLMSTTIVMVWLMLLVDWLSFIVLLLLGVWMAWLFYKLTTVELIIKSDYLGLIIQYFGSLAVVLVFARNKEKINKVKLETIKSVGTNIAHELRTPLATMRVQANILKRCFSKEKRMSDSVLLNKAVIEKVIETPDILEEEIRAATTFIDMLLINVKCKHLTKDKKTCSISCCVNEAIKRYPFQEREKKFISWKGSDFYFKGSHLLVVHVLFNLFKNSLYYIAAANRKTGKIIIWNENCKRVNKLHVKDNGLGIEKNLQGKIFDKFYSKTYHGAGIGLAFCKLVMEEMGGKITCNSEPGKYVEFVLIFPKVKENV